jgi:2,5-diketo-D-gluconate reductase A
MADNVARITLNNGVEIPQLGFGVFQTPDDQVTRAILDAVERGYRSIDTAAGYDNRSAWVRPLPPAGSPARTCSSRPS